MASHGMPRGSGSKPTSEQGRKKELQKIQHYQILVEEVNAQASNKLAHPHLRINYNKFHQIKDHRFTQEVLDLTSKLLKINPEYYTIWNHRRLIIQQLFNQTPPEPPSQSPQTTHEFISNDLNFLVPLLRKYPKCYWIWKYRLWLLEQATHLLPPTYSQSFWQQELTLVSKMLNLDSRNFLGWGYRRTVIAALENTDPPRSLTEEEFNYTTRMIESNLSNFSAWHNRSKLLPRLLREKFATKTQQLQSLDEELSLILRALYADSFDQSLWSYHNFLLTTIAPTPNPSITPITPTPNPSPFLTTLTPSERLHYIKSEYSKILEMLDGSEDCKWIYLSLIRLARMHRELSGGEWPEVDVNGEGEGEGKNRTGEWLVELKRLDPMRGGRWEDLEKELAGL